MPSISDVLLVTLAGLCPLSFLMGGAAVIIFLAATGHVGHWHAKRLENIRPRGYQEAIDEELRDGWVVVNIIPVRSAVNGNGGNAEHRLLDVYLKKWRLF